ncbi:MAG TPA: nucleotide-binding protein [Longimicrobium sp.]|nr:nucleotide-binding protein [Longimicrobium sp.]
MARPAEPPFRTPILLSPEASRGNVSRELAQRIRTGQELHARSITSREDLYAVYRVSRSWHADNANFMRRSFTDQSIAAWYEEVRGPLFGATIDEEAAAFRQRVVERIHRLHAVLACVPAAVSLSEDLSAPGRAGTSPVDPLNKRVFVVHGHDGAAREQTARLLEKLGLEPVILSEQPNAGKTIIEKFEHHSDVGYAVVLLTADDEGGSLREPGRQPRARQNVILELGYFIGKLGRNRVCPIYSEGVELPSDYHGIAYVPLDARGAWRLQLAVELRGAGYDVDLDRAF